MGEDENNVLDLLDDNFILLALENRLEVGFAFRELKTLENEQLYFENLHENTQAQNKDVQVLPLNEADLQHILSNAMSINHLSKRLLLLVHHSYQFVQTTQHHLEAPILRF